MKSSQAKYNIAGGRQISEECRIRTNNFSQFSMISTPDVSVYKYSQCIACLTGNIILVFGPNLVPEHGFFSRTLFDLKFSLLPNRESRVCLSYLVLKGKPKVLITLRHGPQKPIKTKSTRNQMEQGKK